MKTLSIVLALATWSAAAGEVALIWSSNICADVAASRSDVTAFYLPAELPDNDSPNLRAWRQRTDFPRPPPGTLMDLETGLAAPVTGLGDVDAALSNLAVRVDVELNDSVSASEDGDFTWRRFRLTNQILRAEWQTNVAAYAQDRVVATQRIAAVTTTAASIRSSDNGIQNEIEALRKMMGNLNERVRVQGQAIQSLRESRNPK